MRGGWDNLLAVIPGGSSCPCACVARDHCAMRRWISTAARTEIGFGTGGRDRHGQVHRHREGDLAHRRLLLQARKLRPVYAVPRRHRLDDACAGAHGASVKRRSARSTCFSKCDQAGGRPHDLRAWRCGGMADPGPHSQLPPGDRSAVSTNTPAMPCKAGTRGWKRLNKRPASSRARKDKETSRGTRANNRLRRN
jgi:hypothetical protein